MIRTVIRVLVLVAVCGANAGCSDTSSDQFDAGTEPRVRTEQRGEGIREVPGCRGETSDDVQCLGESVAIIVADIVCGDGEKAIISRPGTVFRTRDIDLEPYLRDAFESSGCSWTRDVQDDGQYHCISGPYLPDNMGILTSVSIEGSGEERTLTVGTWCQTRRGSLRWGNNGWVYTITMMMVAQARSWSPTAWR